MRPETTKPQDTQPQVSENAEDAQLDVAEEDSFPASDPPSLTDPTRTIKDGDAAKNP